MSFTYVTHVHIEGTMIQDHPFSHLIGKKFSVPDQVCKCRFVGKDSGICSTHQAVASGKD